MEDNIKDIKDILIKLSFKQIEKLNELQEELADTRVGIIRQAINELYRNTFKDYVRIQQKRLSINESMTPERRAELKAAEEQAKLKVKADKEYQRAKSLCDALEGEEVDKGDYKSCHYNEYQEVEAGQILTVPQKVAFQDLFQHHVDRQYHGSAETRKRIKEKLKDLTNNQ